MGSLLESACKSDIKSNKLKMSNMKVPTCHVLNKTQEK